MRQISWWSAVSLGIALAMGQGVQQAIALPGQLVDEAAAWIQAHPTLRPSSGEKLLVRKSETAAHRFMFQASVLPAGRLAPTPDSGTIRAERISLFDMINSVNRYRLEESLRAIYGLDIYQDYEQARVAYQYPGPPLVNQARNRNMPLAIAVTGELRVGDRFAYWLEVVRTANNKGYNGQITVLLKEDADKLESELRNRGS